MTLLQIYNLIKDVSLAQPNINTVVQEFLDLNREDTKYSAIVIQQRDHQQTSDDFITYNFYIGYVDRLLSDKSNNIDIQSTGINILNNIINYIKDTYYPEIAISAGQYTVFNQRFTAECSGVYTSIALSIPVSDCVDYGVIKDLKPEIVLQDKSIFIDANGNYTVTPSDKYDGMSSVKIGVDVQPNLQSISKSYTANGNYTIRPDEGYDGLSNVDVDVDVWSYDSRHQIGSFDIDGLKALGWDDDSIEYYVYNEFHTPDQDSNYIVTDGNKALYGVVNKDNISNYLTDPNLIYCPYFDTTGVTRMDEMFYHCKSLQSIPLFNTSNADTMGYMFSGCSKLQTIPKLDTSRVASMSSMFSGCISLQSIPFLNTSNVNSMNSMFNRCNSLRNIPKLDTSKVTNMSGMFSDCYLLRTIPLLDTSNVTEMVQMFDNCSSLQSLPQLDTSNVTNMHGIFNGCISLQSIPQLDTSKVTDMYQMFDRCSLLQSIPQLNTSNVTSMTWMFHSCYSLQSIPQLDTSKVTEMGQMFENCYDIVDIPQLDTSKVTNMTSMFENCSKLHTIPRLDMSNVIATDMMFYYCFNLSIINLIGSLNVDLDLSDSTKLYYESIKSILTAASNTTNTGSKTLKFNISIKDRKDELATLVSTCATKGWTITGLEFISTGSDTDYRYMTGTVDVNGLKAIGWNTETINYFNANALHYPWENDAYKVTDGNKALYGVVKSYNIGDYKDNPDFIFCPYFDTTGMTNMNTMFQECKLLKSIPQLDTSNVTDMGYMLNECRSLQFIPPLDTSKVKYMNQTFMNCSSLRVIPPLDTSNVINMNNMFSDCSSLQSIPSLDTSNVTTMGGIFSNCSSLQSIPPLNTSKVTNMNSMFSSCSSLQSIPLIDTSNITSMNYMFNECHSLKSIPLLDTSKVTNMVNMFSNCFSLQSIPQLNTSKVTSMDSMFYFCNSLRTIPQLDTSKVTSMSWMFHASSIQTLPQLDTSKAEDMSYMLYYCPITRIEGLDMSSLLNADGILEGCDKLSYIRLNGSLNVSLNISSTSLLDYDSVKSILTAASNTTNTDSKELTFNSTLTDQNGELASLVSACTAKGWTVSGLTLN